MDPILLKLGTFELPSYRVFIALGGILFFYFLKRRQKEMGLRRKEDFWLLLNVVAISGFVGARLVFLFLEEPLGSPRFWHELVAVNSGFSIFGFVLGILFGVFCYGRILKLDVVRLLDYVFLLIPLWQLCGRMGCFMTGCCYGRPIQHHLPWAVTFTNPAAAIPRNLLGVPLHPAQLYEVLGDGFILLFLYAVILRGIRRGRHPAGLVCVSYLVGYGILRFILEWFRGDTQPFLGPVTSGQALALGLLTLGIFIGVVCRRRDERSQGRTSEAPIGNALNLNVSPHNRTTS